jgi:hypothetical protein
MGGWVPHDLIVQYVPGYSVGEGSHHRRGLETPAKDGTLSVAAHFLDILGDDSGRLLH